MHTSSAGHIQDREQTLFLRRILKGNALFSTISAIVVLLGANLLAEIIGLARPEVYYILGVGLLPFAWFAYHTSAQDVINLKFVKIILVLDVLWVAGSFLLVFSGFVPFTVAGKWVVGLLAEVVAIFAILEFIGLRRLQKERG